MTDVIEVITGPPPTIEVTLGPPPVIEVLGMPSGPPGIPGPQGPPGVGVLPADTAITAPTRIISNKLLVGDTQPAWRVMGDGRQDFGVGGTTAPDLTLYRYGANQLRTDGYLYSGRGLIVGMGVLPTTPLEGIRFGSALDTNLYRLAANRLATDGMFTVGNSITVTPNIFVRNDTGRLYFGLSDDSSLYRAGVGYLATPGRLDVGGAFGITLTAGQATLSRGYFVNGAAATTSILASVLAAGDAQSAVVMRGDGRISWGPGGSTVPDTVLYRNGVGILKTDGALQIGGNVGFFNTAGAAKQTVTGSKGANAALASLMTALAAYGLVTDSTT